VLGSGRSPPRLGCIDGSWLVLQGGKWRRERRADRFGGAEVTAGVADAERPLGAATADHGTEPLPEGREAVAESVENARCTNSHTIQAGNPLRWMRRTLTIARNRPIVATLPRSQYLKDLASSSPRNRRAIVFAACRLPCIVTSATPGSPLSVTMSPTAKTSGCAGSVKSGRTSRRRLRTFCECVAWRPAGLPSTGASAQPRPDPAL